MKKIKVLILSLILLFGTSAVVFAEAVIFNTKTLKYHSSGCRHAQQCKVNCIKIDKQEAIKRGGVPCKVCGG